MLPSLCTVAHLYTHHLAVTLKVPRAILPFQLSTDLVPSDVDGAPYPGTHGHNKIKQGCPDTFWVTVL